ncbi:hypothetical protein EZV62_004238 [Acer yangbiense]|uniref:Uncharacterized protein n=1 Tax=Acer yangbiense TaxID=1000413 RepID=A0A5C7IJ53_9ROSI|nr:hypothetical protein EZV62_004238 [Acer yangbiense]
MADAVISVATEEAVRPLLDSIATQLGYICNYKTNFDNLKKQVQKLQDRRVALEHSINEARRQGEEIEQHVVNWLDSVNMMIDEATKIIEDDNKTDNKCLKSLCPDLKKRYQHSKKAAITAKDVSELHNEGKFDRISYRNLQEETWHPSSKPFEDFESRTSTLTYAINALSNPDVHMVGVHGMGGIGKTTLAREVGRKTEESKIFDVVVFVEVSDSPNIRTIQGVIADKLGLEFREETEPGRANTLRERLKKETKILLILDNIWESLDLEKVGIPFNHEHRGCKLLLTARKANLLSDEMGCDYENNFPIGILNDKEAWDLFKKVVGSCVESPNLQSLAFAVAKVCGGLPIAIVTVAKALKNKHECEWKNALQELQHPLESLEGSVVTKAFSCIQLSYNHLDTEELKSTFLLCCTMECTYKASIEELLRYGMGLNLFKTTKTMEEARYRVNTLVRKLKSSSLLLDTPDSEWFSIHDVVRDVGRAIAFKDHNKFIVIDDVIPREWKDQNTMKNCTSISFHDITKLPNKELDCPLLKFLYMKGKNKYSKIPDNFFIGMSNLRVLHLIKMELSPYPLSLCCLVNLQTLCLNRSWLRDMGFITNIKDLEILVLSCTIEQLPTEIGHLTQLRVLDLSNCYKLKIVPPSIISKLTQLEELYLDYRFDNWHVEGLDNESGNASLDELKHLSQLTILQISILDHKMVPKGLFSQKLQRYNICIGWSCRSKYGTSKRLKLESDAAIVLEDGVITQLKGIEELCLYGRQSVKNALYELDSDGFPQLKHFDIRNNPDLVYIVDSSKEWELPCDAFPLLETLSLTNLIGLEKICHGQLTPNSFCQLRTINVDRCDNLKSMFSLSIAKHLSQLQDISVSNCKNMEDIFTIGRRNDINSNEENDRVVLDQLHSLSLSTLPKLRSFCSEAEVFASTSNEIILEDIPMPLFDGKVQLPNLKTLNLRELQDLYIKDCKALEAIIRIDELGNNVEHPSLKKLKVEKCPEVKAFIFNIDKVSFPNLEEILIFYLNNLEMIWHKDSMKNAQHCQKLHRVDINRCKSLKTLFPLSTARNLFQLKNLEVTRCNGIEEIVAKEGAEDAAARTFVFPQLTCLTLEDLQELKCFYPGIHTIEWPVLKGLKLIGCEKIDELFALELFTFQKNILERQLDIPEQPLSMVKKVFSNLETLSLDGNSSRMIFQSQFPEILFPKLKLLGIQNQNGQPTDLSLGICQRSRNLECLSLEGGSNKEIFWFDVIICPKMKIFALGVVLTPMLREVELDFIDYYCEGDVNTTMQQIHEKRVFSSERLSLSPRDIKMILQKFPKHQFSKLQSLLVFDDESTVFSFGMIQRFHNLEELKLADSSYKEIFLYEEVEKQAETLAQLTSLELEKLDHLEQLWKQDSKLDFILHALETLEVVFCNSLISLMPASASFQNLKSLDVWMCNGLISLVSSSTAKSLVRLEEMSISCCDMVTKIVATEDVEEDKIITFSKLHSLRLDDLSSLASFCSGNHTLNFPSLDRLYVSQCPKMKFFSSGVSSTPLLQGIEYCELDESIWEGDLNTTIQWIHEALNPESSTEDCVGSPKQHMELEISMEMLVPSQNAVLLVIDYYTNI